MRAKSHTTFFKTTKFQKKIEIDPSIQVLQPMDKSDAPKFYKNNKVEEKTQNQQEEIDPSFLITCYNKISCVEIIGYTMAFVLLAIACTAFGFGFVGVACGVGIAGWCLLGGLGIFASCKSEEEENLEPGDYLGL